MSTVMKHVTDGKLNISEYAEDLLTIDYNSQVQNANQPLDYLKPVSYQMRILENSDLIEKVYLKYLEKSKSAPAQALYAAKIDLADKIIAIVGGE